MALFEKPAGITKEFIQNLIQDGNNNLKVLVEDFDVDMPVPKGNNYGSDIYRIKANNRKSNDSNNLEGISFIIKAQINGSISDMAVEAGAADKETLIYKEFIPRLQSEFSANDNNHEVNDIFPKFYTSSEENIIILEDLTCKGYKIIDKIKRLDYEHCVTAAMALAKFHAGSLLIEEKEPELIKKLSNEVMENKSIQEWFSNLLKTTFTVIAEEFKILPNLQKYSIWFEKYSGEIYDLLIDNITKCKENELKVLNHGDFWHTNMLFKTTQNEQMKIKLIDFQCCRYTSPVLDFLNLMDGSAQENVRTEKFDEIMYIYLQEFNSILERHGNLKRLNESEFKKSIADRPYHRIFLSTFCLSFVLADPNVAKILTREEFTQDDLLDTEKTPIRQYIRNENFLSIISKRLLEFEKIGEISLK